MMDNETQKRDEVKEKIKQLLFEQDAVENSETLRYSCTQKGFQRRKFIKYTSKVMLNYKMMGQRSTL